MWRLVSRLKKQNARKPLSAQEEHEVLCTRMGAALLLCQLVERSLARVLIDVAKDTVAEEKWKVGKMLRLNDMITRLGQLRGVSAEFISILHEFRIKRNNLVHELLSTAGIDTSTHDGRITCYRMAAEVHILAGELFRALTTIHADYMVSLGYSWAEYYRKRCDEILPA